MEQVKFMRGDEIDQRLLRQTAFGDGVRQRLGHRVAGQRIAGMDGLDGVAPPLQADHPETGLAHRVAHLEDLGIEGIEGEEMGALVVGHEEGGQVAVTVALADDVLHLVHAPKSTPMRAAATRRFSSSSRL